MIGVEEKYFFFGKDVHREKEDEEVFLKATPETERQIFRRCHKKETKRGDRENKTKQKKKTHRRDRRKG